MSLLLPSCGSDECGYIWFNPVALQMSDVGALPKAPAKTFMRKERRRLCARHIWEKLDLNWPTMKDKIFTPGLLEWTDISSMAYYSAGLIQVLRDGRRPSIVGLAAQLRERWSYQRGTPLVLWLWRLTYGGNSQNFRSSKCRSGVPGRARIGKNSFRT